MMDTNRFKFQFQTLLYQQIMRPESLVAGFEAEAHILLKFDVFYDTIYFIISAWFTEKICRKRVFEDSISPVYLKNGPF